MIHLRRYITALAFVLILYGGYALAVVPLLQPPPPIVDPKVPLLPVLPEVDIGNELARLFPPGSWELEKPKVVETEHMTLLVQDYQPTPDGKLALTPCTLIFYTTLASNPAAGAKPVRRPIVMQAPRGAVLQFDRPLNIAKAEFGQLIGGNLPGEINIYSPATSPAADDALHLTTRNVQIEPTRVFTPHDVTFSFGKSSGRGRDLTLALIAKDPDAPAGSGAVGGVRSLTLASIDRLHIETGAGGLLPTSGATAENNPVAGGGPLEVTCAGPFVFDMTERLAMFDEQVVVERSQPGKEPDVLRCDRLRLYLNSAESQSGQIERIVALGSPANLTAPSSTTRASAARIEYDLAKRRLALLPSQAAPQVSLGQETGEFLAREMEYEQAAAGRLGRLWAAGPGQLTMVQIRGETRQTIIARWEKELRIRPQEESQVISLVEAASITADPLGNFSANELHLWVRETTTPAAVPGGKAKTAIVPERLLATENVKFDSPQLHAETPRLEAFFQNRPAVPKPAAPADPATPRPAPAAERPPSMQKFDVKGDLVRMQVLVQGEEIQLEDLIISDRVRIDETRTAEPGQVPVRISGDLATLRGGTTPQAQIDVSGKPAIVGGRGMSLAGGAIHVRREENRLWIDGPGEAQLPVPAQPATRGAPPPPPQQATVVWQDGLVFDGQTAQIRGEVQARTATQVANCRTLDATLARRIDFAAPSTREPAELASLKLDGGVFLENRSLDERGEQVSYDLVQVQNLTLDRAAGKMRADGPGWVSTTRIGGAALPGAPPGQPMPVAVPQPGAGQSPLTYVRITFEGGIDGDLAKRTIVFQRDVKTTYSQVNDWKEQVIARQLSDLGPRGVMMTSQALTVVEMVLPGQPRWIEISATGNVVVEGQTFTAQAPLVGYGSDKEVLTLEGNGRADAELWYRDAPGQASSYASARKWRYWLRTGMFDVEDAKVFNLNQFQGGRIRLPPAQGFQ